MITIKINIRYILKLLIKLLFLLGLYLAFDVSYKYSVKHIFIQSVLSIMFMLPFIIIYKNAILKELFLWD